MFSYTATQWTAIGGVVLALLTLLMYLDTHATNRKVFLGVKYEHMLILLNGTIEVLAKWQKEFSGHSTVVYPRNVVNLDEIRKQREDAELMGVQVELYASRNLQFIVSKWISEMNAAMSEFNSAYENPKYDSWGQLIISPEFADGIAEKSLVHIDGLRTVHRKLSRATRRDLKLRGVIFRLAGLIAWNLRWIKHKLAKKKTN